MFSTFTDRFFHGMNKKHTKMVDASNLKANLQTSRSRWNSRSRQKTARMFDTNPNHTIKSSLNSTVRVGTSTDNFRSTSSQFALPPQLHNEKKRSYYHRKNNYTKNGTALFTPPLAVGQLQELLQKHTGDAPCKEPLTNRENSSDVHTNSVLLSFKEKLKQKIQQNAIKKFSNIHHPYNKTGRVDQDNIKQLLSLISKDKNNKHVGKQIHDENQKQIQDEQSQSKQSQTEKTPFQKIIKQEIAKQVNKLNLQQKPTQIKSKVNITEPQLSNKGSIAEHKYPNQSKKSENQKIQKSEVEKKNIIAPVIQQKPSAVNIIKNSEATLKSTKVQQTMQKSDTKKVEDTKITKPAVLKKDENQKKQQLNTKLQKDIRKSNSFWSQDIDQMFQDPPTQSVQPIKQNKPEQNKIAVVHPQVAANNNKRTNTSNSVNISEDVDQDELDEIQLEIIKQQSQKVIASNLKTKTQVVEKLKPNLIQKQKKENPVKAPQNKKTNTKQNKKLDEVVIPDYNEADTQTDIQYIISLISEIGFYAQNLVKFYSQSDTRAFNEDSQLLCYYLWQHFYYLKTKCLQILRQKQQNFFYVPKRALQKNSVQQFLNDNIEAISQQNEKAIKRVQKSHQAVKHVLPVEQRQFSTNKQNYYERTLRYLQKQFYFIEKLYRESVHKSAKKLEDNYIDRLCKIIEIFCLIKYLGGEKRKEFVESEQIENLTKHYQDYKHLVVL